MSFADELRRAEKRMKAQNEQEAQKKPKKRSVSRSSSSDASAGKAVWHYEDDVIAFYLERTDASKFFKENYSKKRKVAVRAMERQMEGFRDLMRGRPNSGITEQMQKVHQQFRTTPAKDHQQVVIGILRGDSPTSSSDSTPTLKAPQAESHDRPEATTVLKRK